MPVEDPFARWRAPVSGAPTPAAADSTDPFSRWRPVGAQSATGAEQQAAGPTAPPQDPTTPPSAPAPQTGGFMGGLEQLGSHLPTAGAMIGGFAGGGVGPVSRGGAAFGAAGGEAFNQLIQHLPGGGEGPQSSARAFKQISEAAAAGAASQLGGQLIGKAGGWIGGRLMRSAAGRSALQQVAKRFPTVDVVNTLLRERIPIGRTAFGKRGSEIAGEKVAASATRLSQLLASADKAGVTHSIDDILRPVKLAAGELWQKPASKETAEQMFKYIEQETAKFGLHKLTSTEVQELIKLPAQQIGYKTRVLDIASDAKKQFTRALAKSAQASLENIKGIGPRIAARNQRTQSLMAAQRAVDLAERRGGAHLARLWVPLLAAGAGGAAFGLSGGGSTAERVKRGAIGVGAGLAATSPMLQSRAALTLTSSLAPTVSQLMSNLVGGQLSRREPEPQP